MSGKSPVNNSLRAFFEVIEAEYANNPDFAEKIDAILRPSQDVALAAPPARARAPAKRKPVDAPDVHAELAARGEEGLRAWLGEQAADVLKAIIRKEDLDAARRAAKWKSESKLADFIVDGLRARMSRGGAFIGRTRDEA